jgi:Sigma-70, region 4
MTESRISIAKQTSDDLRSFLKTLCLDRVNNSRARTKVLTRAVVMWAERKGWIPASEVHLDYLSGRPEYPGRRGVVDLYIARPDRVRDLVVEIDSSNKRWSLAKLKCCAENGVEAIWIRWSGLRPSVAKAAYGVEIIFLGDSLTKRAKVSDSALLDLRMVATGDLLSGASLALLTELYPVGGPIADARLLNEELLWGQVSKLRPRLAFVVRCRFGHFTGQQLTLDETAELLADHLGKEELSRERVRQLQERALHTLRRRLDPAVLKEAPARGDVKRNGDAAYENKGSETRAVVSTSTVTQRLPRMVEDIVRSVGGDSIRLSMICHILRGSDGPVTRRKVSHYQMPYDGALRGIEYSSVLNKVRAIVSHPPFVVDDGSVRIE